MAAGTGAARARADPGVGGLAGQRGGAPRAGRASCATSWPRPGSAAASGPGRGTPRAASCCPRDRVDALLDPGSPFLELAPLAADGMYEGRPRPPG